VHVKSLQKAGNSVRKVEIATESDRLVVGPGTRARHTLDELLAQCKPRAKRGKADREWLGIKPVGRELI
jgi:antitoxin ChpS